MRVPVHIRPVKGLSHVKVRGAIPGEWMHRQDVCIEIREWSFVTKDPKRLTSSKWAGRS